MPEDITGRRPLMFIHDEVATFSNEIRLDLNLMPIWFGNTYPTSDPPEVQVKQVPTWEEQLEFVQRCIVDGRNFRITNFGDNLTNRNMIVDCVTELIRRNQLLQSLLDELR